MKYPFVIFYRKERFNYLDDFFIVNADKLNCTIFIANCVDNVKKLHNSNFHLLITFGDSFEEYQEEEGIDSDEDEDDGLDDFLGSLGISRPN